VMGGESMVMNLIFFERGGGANFVIILECSLFVHVTSLGLKRYM
jgi:hypothetical protein